MALLNPFYFSHFKNVLIFGIGWTVLISTCPLQMDRQTEGQTYSSNYNIDTICLYTFQWCRNWGARGGGPLASPIFGKSVNPILIRGGQIIPTYYYYLPPPQFFFTFWHHCIHASISAHPVPDFFRLNLGLLKLFVVLSPFYLACKWRGCKFCGMQKIFTPMRLLLHRWW